MTRARTLADLGSASLATDAELASEVSTINSAIAAKPTYAFSASAPSSPSNGDLWMDTSGASPKGKVWNGSEWKSFSGASVAAFDEGASTGATFTTLTNPDGDGKNYRLAAFTSTSGGSLVISEGGAADVLIVGAGGGSSPSVRGGGGGGGAVLEFSGIVVPVGTHSVTVGLGGNPGTGHYGGAPGGVIGSGAGRGGSSYVSFLDVRAVGGGGGGAGVSAGTGTSQNIRGTSGASGGGSGAYSSNSQEAVDGMGFSNNGSTAGGGAGALGSTASGATKAAGKFSDITGASVEYGAGGTSPNGDWGPHSYTIGIGWGGRGNAGERGGNGVVYVRVEI